MTLGPAAREAALASLDIPARTVAGLSQFLDRQRQLASDRGRARALRCWREKNGVSLERHALMCELSGRFDHADLIKKYG